MEPSLVVKQVKQRWIYAALVLCGAAFAGGWAVSEWLTVLPLRAQLGDRNRDIESLRDQVSSLRYRNERLQRQQEPDTSSLPDTSINPRQQSPVPEAPVHFRGPVYNETMRQGGQMSLVIRRQGPSGSVRARFEAWGSLSGSGDLAGNLSEDGRLSASGQLMMGKNSFDCDLSGVITGDKLVGSANFVRSRGGRVAHSSFTLTKS